MKNLTYALLLSAFFLTGCETNQKRRAVPAPVFDLRTNAAYKDEIFQGDVGVSLKPINLESAYSNERFFAVLNFWNPANPRNSGMDKILMISVPAFEIQVVNSSKNPISFGKVSVRLLDDAGNSYQAVLKQDVQDLVNQRVAATKNNGWRVDDSTAMQAVKSLKLFDKNYEGLPGIVEKRIISFDIGNQNNVVAYRKMMASTKYFRVVMYGVPVELDNAGNVVKTSKFEYLFDVVRRN